MQIPSHWAEATLHHAQDGRKITIRRYGWSDTSEADAQRLADERAHEALARAAAGEDVVRREPRRGYNGAEGTPIREEIVDQRGDSVLTRNSYGAVCLNTPDVLFVDIDDAAFEPPVVGNAGVWVAGILLALAAGIFVNLSYAPHGWLLAGLILMGTALIGLRQGRRGEALGAQRRETALARVRGQIEQFLAARPDWRLRLYRTPAGLRLLAVHRTFTPDEAEAQACFAAFEADPIYTRMCQSQRCFRARVSPKPWRMSYRRGLPTALAHWPVPAASRQARERWIQDYTGKAKAFASCHFLEEFGSGTGHPRALAVQDWHDELCRAHEARLPLA
ncbi:MAG: hypothetical protein GAK30_02583 [Paracidovorax wautersii]|uniref:Uncharacterized protein n=1 Tax=Paracidovorax wautersii TaxID=1177982 RepID=A0A7V8FMR9_9BURK|nr:MAG: hypothetical protein GAK30_02583 [Paracidovorax wautersii]